MEKLHHYWRFTHIFAGSLGLFAFWIPVLATKGSRLHRVAGLLFLTCVWIVVITSLLSVVSVIAMPEVFFGPRSEAADRVAYAQRLSSARFFLAMLGILALSTLEFAVVGRHAVLAHSGVRSLRYLPVMLLVGLTAVCSFGYAAYGVLLLAQEQFESGAIACAVGGITLSAQRKEWRYLVATDHDDFAWWLKHMEGMVNAGIAFHTAFAVFGGQRFFSQWLVGPWRIVPWVTPACLGVAALLFWKRRYRAKFDAIVEAGQPDSTLVGKSVSRLG